MKISLRPVIAFAFALMIFGSSGAAQAQWRTAVEIHRLAKQLRLSSDQEKQLTPLLQQEAPKVDAIKNNKSLTSAQKAEQLGAIHQQTDPQIKSILTPDQYSQWQGMRQQRIQEVMKRRPLLRATGS